MKIANGKFTKKDLGIKYESKSTYKRTVVNAATIIAATGEIEKN